eukprot:scaffold274399_cov37-Tisochrysis_lutea.AAC.1
MPSSPAVPSWGCDSSVSRPEVRAGGWADFSARFVQPHTTTPASQPAQIKSRGGEGEEEEGERGKP